MGEALEGLRVSGNSSTMDAAGFTCYLPTVVGVPVERCIVFRHHHLSVHATRSPGFVRWRFFPFVVIYTGITVAIIMLDLSYTQTIAV